ncbi:MAG: beta-ketoacyl-[acyl-carrier-protein] synthase family protein [Cyclobacteriaceae bacterium]|nr:beta-ketoacyl-[acyl-carrier-protein] synthase family protein [Cyclobacteriaceae bacterium]
MSEKIVVTGMGMISSLGVNVPESYSALVSGKTGFGKIEILETAHRESIPAFEVKWTDAQLREWAGVEDGTGYTRTSLLALIAAKEAVQSANISQVETAQSGFISATTTGGIRELEKYFFEMKDPNKSGTFLQFADTGNPGEHTERVADALGLTKYIATVSTACSSSANCIMLGAQLLKARKLDRVIVGGAEALSCFTINGFLALMILDKGHCRPFDANRKGLNLGEGAAYLVLERELTAMARGAKILATLTGYGNANDAFHQTASSPDGAGALRSMQLAIVMSGLALDDIDYINAHGTATENNDLSEGIAIQKLFSGKLPMVSSTKPFTGHTLAAAGSMEAAISILTLQHQVVFPNLNFTSLMPELNFSPEVSLRQNRSVKNVLSNSFGFGGNTSTLMLSAH